MDRIPIVFDNEAGADIDDLFALALALRQPRLGLLGMTTVGGGSVKQARLVAKMLRPAGRADMPVRAGDGR